MAGKSKFGPGFLVAAAFIGPGTITSATLAGSRFGFTLIWVVVISVLSAVILQEMTGRFSLATKLDIATALVRLTPSKLVKKSMIALASVAVIFGCTAYEAGNIIGGGLGLKIITGVELYIWAILISIVAIFLLLLNSYRLIEKVLVGLVVVMGFSFLISAFIVRPDLSQIVHGFIPVFPQNSLLLILALLGTTVVPYNLFLHSASVLKKWQTKKDLSTMRKDLFLSVGLGGLITISVIVTASAAYFLKGAEIKNPADLSLQLVPLYGPAAKIFFGIGLFAAGLSSAITAPYAAAWTAKGLFGWKEKSWKFSMVFTVVILFGAVASLLSIKPLQMIIIAQVANALVLPVVAVFLVYLLNKKEAGSLRNGLIQNLLFLLVFTVIVLLNLKKLL